MPPPELRIGRYYSNGAYGRAWGVRLLVALVSDATGATEVVFRGVAGQCRRRQGQIPLADFTRWARYEVALNENSWQRVGAADADPD
jgi:hypothetical protein